MRNVKLYFIGFQFFMSFFLSAQNTVGLLSYDPTKAFDGYNLLYPHNQPHVYLLDNCGEIVHVWEDTPNSRPGNTAYLLEDGRLVKTKRPAIIAGDAIWAGGGGATVEIRDWNNNLEWSYTINNDSMRMHHDIEVLPNGHILMIVWELKTAQEALEAGRDPDLLTDGELWPDFIREVNPKTDEIVWEWHVWDHLIQDYDATKSNYGVVEENPQRVDINWDTSNGADDWMHTNSIDYNPETDQIIISVPTFNEFWIIDHSTSTAEAAGSTGGLGGRGGDLLYRWGNPVAYRAGGPADQRLYYQHDAHWVRDFIDPFHPNYGKIAVFNNQIGPDFSSAHLLSTPFDMYEWVYPMNGNTWGPDNFDLTLVHPQDSSQMYSTGLSSIQFLPNGNFLICSGRTGYSFELTDDSEIVWAYVTPLNGGSPVNQGDTTLVENSNMTFRMTRYPSTYSAFANKDLTSLGWIELNPNTTFCDQILPFSNTKAAPVYQLFPNPANQFVFLNSGSAESIQLAVFDQLGRQFMTHVEKEGDLFRISTENWQEGVYFLRINGSHYQKLMVLHRD